MSNEMMTLEELSKRIKFELRENTVVLFKVSNDECKHLVDNLKYSGIEKMLREYNITAIVCPDHIQVQVIPARSQIEC